MFKKIRTIFMASVLTALLSMSSIVIFAETASPGSDPGQNLLINQGFESGSGDISDNWTFTSYKDLGKGKWDNTVAHGGTSSIRIENKVATDSRFIQAIKVEPDTIYEMSCWVKTQNVGKEHTGANISFKDCFAFSSEKVVGTRDWVQVFLYGQTAKDQTEITLSVGLGGYGQDNTGTVWVDDVVMKKASALPEGVSIQSLELNTKSSNTASETSKKSPVFLTVALVLILILIVFALIYILFVDKKKNKTALASSVSGRPEKTSAKHSISAEEECAPNPPPKIKLERKDFLIIGIVTILYSIIAIFNLGSTKVPQTSWSANKSDTSFVINLNQETAFTKIGYYQGYGEGNYTFQYLDTAGNFKDLGTLDKKMGEIFRWGFLQTSATTSKLKVIINDPGTPGNPKSPHGDINELTLTDNSGNPINLSNATFEEVSNEINANDLHKLIDEQSYCQSRNTFETGTYFDEIYHARTAYENLHQMPVYETTHPPLGKYLMAQGIRVFGMNPFGWRIVGVLFGVFMVPLMFLFGLKLFRRRIYAFAAMLLMAVEFMHLTMSRIATIDIYGAFFVLLIYYFIYDYYVYKSYNIGYRNALYSLFMTGIAFGLGCASKWICVYAGGGLATLFLLVKIQEYRDYSRLRQKYNMQLHGWLKTYVQDHIMKTIACCIIFLLLIPAGIYAASYIPTYLDVPNSGVDTLSQKVDKVLDNQSYMFSYHKNLKVEKPHPFASRWYDWPLDSKPLLAYRADNPPPIQKQTSAGLKITNMAASISVMGNPAIVWLSIICVPLALFLLFTRKKKTRGMTVVFVAILFQYVPWIIISRETYMYHFFSTIPFLIMTILYVFYCFSKNDDTVKDDYNLLNKPFLTAYLVLCTLFFFAFYPVISGLTVPSNYVKNITWFKWGDTNKFFRWPF